VKSNQEQSSLKRKQVVALPSHHERQRHVQMGGLLSAFKKQTGQDYNGDEQQTNMLSSLAHQVQGILASLMTGSTTGPDVQG
jgi:hypothetical protein